MLFRSYADGFNWNGNTYYESGDYTFYGHTSAGCDSTVVLHLTIYRIEAYLNVTHFISCYGAADAVAEVIVTSGAPVHFLWSTGATTQNVSGLAEGVYMVLVYNDFGCEIELELDLTGPPPLTVSTVGHSPTCFKNCNEFALEEGTIDFAINGGTPNWTLSIPSASINQEIDPDLYGDGELAASYVAGIFCEGEYCFTVTDANGCSASGCVTITVPEQIVTHLPSITACDFVDLPWGVVTESSTYEIGRAHV